MSLAPKEFLLNFLPSVSTLQKKLKTKFCEMEVSWRCLKHSQHSSFIRFSAPQTTQPHNAKPLSVDFSLRRSGRNRLSAQVKVPSLARLLVGIAIFYLTLTIELIVKHYECAFSFILYFENKDNPILNILLPCSYVSFRYELSWVASFNSEVSQATKTSLQYRWQLLHQPISSQ